MAASAPKARRKPAKNRGRARRGLGLAGASVFATTGILGAYVGYPGLRRANAAEVNCTVTLSTDTLPNGVDGELRDCLNDMDNNFGSITFNSSLNITLLADLPYVTINGGPVTITGAGKADTVIDRGTGSFKGFRFGGDDVTVSSLTIQNSSVTYNGSAIELGTANTLTMSSIELDGNRGDAAATSMGSVTVRDSEFTNNSASSGGAAIFAYYGANVTDSRFSNNFIRVGGSYRDGGAIYSRNYDLSGVTIVGSTFENNSATDSGGAVYVYFGDVSIQESTFDTNSAGTYGGAVFAYYGTVTIADSQFYDNSADRGGAVGTYDRAGVNTHEIVGSTFRGNSASTSGGGAVYAYDSGLEVENSTFASNTASRGGGAILINDDGGASSTTITSSTFSGNAANYGGGFYGGGAIYTKGATDVVNSTFVGNSGYDGAAIKGYSDDVSINFSTITSNTSVGGAGVYVSSVSAVTIANSILYGNIDSSSATANDAISAGTLTVSNSLLTSNSSFSAAGTVTTSDLIEDEDPLLGSLANNGGPTQTMLPAANSPVIGMADPSGAPQFDQRGFTRTTNGLADMGSVERGGTAPEPDLSQMPPTWFQAQQRQEQSAVCPPGMVPSWAEWPNEQTGGWTCEWSTWWDVNKGTSGGWVTTPGFNPGLRVSD